MSDVTLSERSKNRQIKQIIRITKPSPKKGAWSDLLNNCLRQTQTDYYRFNQNKPSGVEAVRGVLQTFPLIISDVTNGREVQIDST